MDFETAAMLEDGEIDEDEIYIPLERPINNVVKPELLPNFNDKNSDNDSECEWSIQSDTDSDGPPLQAKKPKFRPKKIFPQRPKRKKYDIWSSCAQEDVLAETLNTCDVSKFDRSRDVETYGSYDLRHKIRKNTKRRHNERNKGSKFSSPKKEDSDEDEVKGSARVVADLVTNVNNTDEEIAKDIANKLCEEKDDLILRIVKIAGKQKAIEIFNKTKEVELDGGILIMNRTRRRTPGGVFLFLLKKDEHLPMDQQRIIFSESRQEQLRERRALQKAKLKSIKEKYGLKKKSETLPEMPLPELLSRRDLILLKLSPKREPESESEEYVNNPPPSPVTDGKETSNDGMNEEPISQPSRSLNSYNDDFLDMGCDVETDMF